MIADGVYALLHQAKEGGLIASGGAPPRFDRPALGKGRRALIDLEEVCGVTYFWRYKYEVKLVFTVLMIRIRYQHWNPTENGSDTNISAAIAGGAVCKIEKKYSLCLLRIAHPYIVLFCHFLIAK